jgi:hypothetical protein
LAGVVTFYFFPVIDRLGSAVLLFDGAGLALFAVSGTQKALAFGLNPIMAALLGMLTGIGGGMVRDVLVAEIPIVLRRSLRRRRPGRRGGSCDWQPTAIPLKRSDDRGGSAVLRTSRHGY